MAFLKDFALFVARLKIVLDEDLTEPVLNAVVIAVRLPSGTEHEHRSSSNQDTARSG